MRLLHAFAGLDAELLQEIGAGVAERGQRLGLPPALVQGDHQLRPQALAQRELVDQPDQVAASARCGGRGPARCRPTSPRRWRGRRRAGRGPRRRPGRRARPAPHRATAPSALRSASAASASRPALLLRGGLAHRRLEDVGVERARVGPQDVTAVGQGEQLARGPGRTLRLQRRGAARPRISARRWRRSPAAPRPRRRRRSGGWAPAGRRAAAGRPARRAAWPGRDRPAHRRAGRGHAPRISNLSGVPDGASGTQHPL